MNAYLTCDRIEERRWINQQIQDEKDKWIDDRAEEEWERKFSPCPF